MSIPPNRIAVLTGLLSAVVGALATLLGAVDTIEKALVVCVGLLVVAGVLVVYLLGWQKHENLVAHGRMTIDQLQAPPPDDPEPAVTDVASLSPLVPGIDGAKLLPDEIPDDLDSARADALAADPPIKPVTA